MKITHLILDRIVVVICIILMFFGSLTVMLNYFNIINWKMSTTAFLYFTTIAIYSLFHSYIVNCDFDK